MSGKSFANWESSYDISSFDFLILPPDPLTLDVWRGGVIVGSLEFSNCHGMSQDDWSQLGDRVFFTLFCYLSSLDRRELETTILAFSYIQEGTMISSRQSVEVRGWIAVFLLSTFRGADSFCLISRFPRTVRF